MTEDVKTTETTTNVVAAVETPAVVATEKKAPVVKTTHYIIYQDKNGVEISREVKGKGRPPRGGVKQANGDFIVSPLTSPTRFIPQYITVDESGNEVARESKGRGRPKPGFVKQTGGVNDGHWVKVASATPVVVATEVPAATA